MTRFGFLSTFPPTRCGLATFTDALARALVADGQDEVVVVRVDDLVPVGPPTPGPGIRVVGDLRPGDGIGRSRAATLLNYCDMVIVQHEFGIYGGPDGDEVIDVLERVLSTRVVVLHTVPKEPTSHQRAVLRRVTELADRVVVMTRAAYLILTEQYSVPTGTVALIPHGVDLGQVIAAPSLSSPPVVLTWGLIGPGKGIEWGIRALACIEPDQRPIYHVLGQTHPKVLRDQGEQYRNHLRALAVGLGVSDDLVLDGHYQEPAALAVEIASAALVLLPYDSYEQVTSGVLAEAVAAGKVVVATRFPHAVELLSDGGGILTAHKRPLEMAKAIRVALSDPTYAAAARARADGIARAHGWDRVADRFRELLAGGLAERALG
jgi:glycosyltransferase involved in cell wall biosynthesis